MKIMTNVTVHTMDSDSTTADAIVWENGRIVAVGNEKELQSKYGLAERVDGKGGAVFPGFIDPHIHFLDGVIYKGSLDCTPEKTPTIAALMEALKEIAKEAVKGQWIVGHGYDNWAFPEKRNPNRYDLDEVAPNNPVILTQFSFHECIVNTRALELAGIDRNTPQPMAGEIVKDAKGEPTGQLIEMAMGVPRQLSRCNLIEMNKEKILKDISLSQNDLFACGITAIGDAATSSDLEDLYEEAFDHKLLKIQVVKNICANEDMFQLPWDRVNSPRKPAGSDYLKEGPLKIFLDGGERAAVVMSVGRLMQTLVVTLVRCIKSFSLVPIAVASRSPIRFGKGLKVHMGTMMADTDECIKLVTKATEQGMSLAFHAIGNEAVNQAIDVISQVRQKHKDYPPPRIEHALLLDDEMIAKIKALGIAIVTQPYLLTHMSSENLAFIPAFKQLPLKSLLNAGVTVAGSSDWPVTTFEPMEAIQRAVTRITQGKEILQKHEAISVREAINMYTASAAWVMGRSDEMGSLEQGKRANFIIFSEDPLAENKPINWQKIKIKNTFLDGEEVFSSVT